MTSHVALSKGLPANIDAERFVLGSIQLDDSRFVEVASTLHDADFALEKHRRIFAAMLALDLAGSKIDRVTLAEELMRRGELDSVDGLSYLCTLDDGLPHVANLDSYVDILVEKSRLRRIAIAAQGILNRAIDGTDTPDEILSGADAAMLDIRPSRNAVDIWQTPGQCIASVDGGLKGFLEPADATGILSPFPRLNESIGGFKPQQLIILAGRPSHGKSAAGLQLAWHAIQRHKIEVAYVSLEMSRESLTQRLIVMHGRADLHRLRLGYLTREEKSRLSMKAADVQDCGLWIDDRGGQTSASIRRSIRQLCSRRPIGMVFIDHLHLIRSGEAREGIREQFSRIANDLQCLAKEINIPVVALAQCSRDCEKENRPPGMPDLKETGTLEENADLVLFAYRPEMYHRNREKDELKGVAEIIIAKQRNGPIGTVHLRFNGGMSMFESPEGAD